VKPYLKRNKTDAADAEAICEAVGRPNMRFVPIKGIAQQAILTLHRTRALLVRQRTATINAVRGLLGEFGLVSAKGRTRFDELRRRLSETAREQIPEEVRSAVKTLFDQVDALTEKVEAIESWAVLR
jgi:transposase